MWINATDLGLQLFAFPADLRQSCILCHFFGVGVGDNSLDMQATLANIKHGRRSFSRCTSPSSVCIMVDRLLQDTEPPAEMVKHQTNISELKRSFLETGSSTPGLTEWEKRLSSSPARSPRADEAPMIEPLELEDVSCSSQLTE